jgi:YggT family protein
MAQVLIFLVQTLLGMYVMVLLTRFLLQWVRADFYNPVVQALVKITQPLVGPLQKIVPYTRRISLATLLIAMVVQMLLMAMVILLRGYALPDILSLVMWSLISLADYILDILFFALIGSIILSWVAPHSYHPSVMLIRQLTEPLIMPVRRLLPSLGGLDFSPIVVFIVIHLIRIIVIHPLAEYFRMPGNLVIGW